MNAPSTRAGQWLVDHSQWDEGLRAFRVRINATAGPEDMLVHTRTIEREAVSDAITWLQTHLERLPLYGGYTRADDVPRFVDRREVEALLSTYLKFNP